MRPKILYVVNVDWFFLSHRLPIAISAQNSGFEVHIACQFTEKGSDIRNHNFILHEIPLDRSGTSVLKEIKTFLAIHSLIRKIKPEIIRAITIKPVLYSGIASRFYKVARIASISGLGFVFIAEGFKEKIIKSVVVLLCKLALTRKKTKVIFQNSSDKSLFIKQNIIIEKDSIIVRGSGVDLNKCLVQPEPAGVPVFALLARLLIDKGVIEFVEAAKLLKSKGVHCRMILVGDTDENPQSVTSGQIKQWQNDGLIEYWGFTSDVKGTYAKCNVAVLPSYREGLPKSLIEAAACGRAVITTDVPGCRDSIIANETRQLVPLKNPLALADAIKILCNDQELRKRFGASGRQHAESEFDINAVVQQHVMLYRSLVET